MARQPRSVRKARTRLNRYWFETVRNGSKRFSMIRSGWEPYETVRGGAKPLATIRNGSKQFEAA